jgi:prolipoprotein diacylglyceryl transferase
VAIVKDVVDIHLVDQNKKGFAFIDKSNNTNNNPINKNRFNRGQTVENIFTLPKLKNQFMLSYITWTVDPAIIEEPLEVRWYGLFFATAFLAGYQVLKKIFDREGVPQDTLDKLLIYVMVGTVIGARLGHVFFYDWDYYSQNLLDILNLRQGGLASHGAAVGIILALWLFSKRVTKKSILWGLDRVVIVVALGGFFIRLGNLMNHEIVGLPTDLPWGVIFTKAYVANPELPRHPAQVYEAIACIILFAFLYFRFKKQEVRDRIGDTFGWFLVILFSSRFAIEFVKNSQGGFESVLGVFSTGQWLSIPFVLAGVYFIIAARKKAKA